MHTWRWHFSHSVVSDSCDPVDCSPPGSSLRGVSQAGILGWVAISSSSGSSRARDQTPVSDISGGFFTSEPPGKPILLHMPTLFVLYSFLIQAITEYWVAFPVLYSRSLWGTCFICSSVSVLIPNLPVYSSLPLYQASLWWLRQWRIACNVGDLGSIPGLGRYPGEGKGYPLQYSDLENSMDCV